MGDMPLRRAAGVEFGAGIETPSGDDPRSEESGIESATACIERTLLDAFPRTIEAWRRANRERTSEDLAASFAQSPYFEAYRTRASSRRGISLEEAFLRFTEENAIGDRATSKIECARALIWMLVATPDASYDLPDFVLRAPRGHFVVIEVDGGMTLFAAIEGRLVTGRVTPFLAELLTAHEPPSFTALRFDVSQAELAASCNVLRRIGLLP
jgi:hypothetical protein